MKRGELPVPPLAESVELEPHLAGLREGRLLLPRCRRCAAVIWYPRAFCPQCGSLDVDWFEASGRGTIYSFTVVRRGQGPYATAAPYVLAYVELAEGPRVLTNVNADPAALAIGTEVKAVVERDGEAAILRFRPARGA